MCLHTKCRAVCIHHANEVPHLTDGRISAKSWKARYFLSWELGSRLPSTHLQRACRAGELTSPLSADAAPSPFSAERNPVNARKALYCSHIKTHGLVLNKATQLVVCHSLACIKAVRLAVF